MGSSNPTRMESEGLSHAHAACCSTGNEDMQLWLVGAGMLSTLVSPPQLPCDVLCPESEVTFLVTFITALLCQHCLQPHAAGLLHYCRQLGVGKAQPNSACGYGIGKGTRSSLTSDDEHHPSLLAGLPRPSNKSV